MGNTPSNYKISNDMRLRLFSIICSLACFSCQSGKQEALKYRLEETADTLSFEMSSNSSLFIKSMSVFQDDEGKEYMTFMSNEVEEIYVYDLMTENLVKTISYDMEGANGVGPKAAGFLMKSWNEIFIPNLYLPEISLIDSGGYKKQTYKLDSLGNGYGFIPTRSTIGTPFVLYEDLLFGMQLPNMRLGEDAVTNSPVGLMLDLGKKEIDLAPFHYPHSVMKNSQKPSLGIETKMSYCFNGEELVLSFAFDETLYKMPLKGGTTTSHIASSSYLGKISLPEKVPSDLILAAKEMCELPIYGNIIYDKYRNVYYRVAYPQKDYDMDENFVELWQSGRGEFSIMILDEGLNVIGETLLPENKYRSDLMLLLEDGLYISTSHYKNTAFNEDRLEFQRFTLFAMR